MKRGERDMTVEVITRWRGPPATGRPVPLEGVTLRGDRATALIEDIWCEKIRGCSYREAVCLYSMSAMPP